MRFKLYSLCVLPAIEGRICTVTEITNLKGFNSMHTTSYLSCVFISAARQKLILCHITVWVLQKTVAAPSWNTRWLSAVWEYKHWGLITITHMFYFCSIAPYFKTISGLFSYKHFRAIGTRGRTFSIQLAVTFIEVSFTFSSGFLRSDAISWRLSACINLNKTCNWQLLSWFVYHLLYSDIKLRSAAKSHRMLQMCLKNE